MTIDIGHAIRDIGVSDMRTMAIDPRQGPLDEWRAARIKRGMSVAQALARENRAVSETGQRGATARTAAIQERKVRTRTAGSADTRRLRGVKSAAGRAAAWAIWVATCAGATMRKASPVTDPN